MVEVDVENLVGRTALLRDQPAKHGSELAAVGQRIQWDLRVQQTLCHRVEQ
jgi:hypothetical protein